MKTKEQAKIYIENYYGVNVVEILSMKRISQIKVSIRAKLKSKNSLFFYYQNFDILDIERR